MRNSALKLTLALMMIIGSCVQAQDGEEAGVTEEVICRSFIPPGSAKHHGELRLLRRGDQLCMQTLLVSTSLRRGLAQIRKEELYHWPSTRDGYEDSTAYLDGLERSKKEVFAHITTRTGETYDPYQRLLIEFVTDADVSYFAFYDVDTERVDDGWQIVAMKLISKHEASPVYVRGAMKIMAENGFGSTCPEFADMLE